MRLRPSTPFIELLTLGILPFGFIKSLFDEGFAADKLVGFGAILLVIESLGIYLFNKNFRSLEISDTLIRAKGYFFGKRELKIEDIRGYKLKEVKRTKLMISDYNLVFVNKLDKEEEVGITQGDFKSSDWDTLIDKLKTRNIEFLGQEELREQWKRQWSSFKKRFTK